MEVDAKVETTVSQNAPIVLIVLGMAGSGKTTFVHVSPYGLTHDCSV
jgi:polynucleotide 5'-kinase involved in rRNA processing